jgi:glutathione S-transferase
MRQSRFACWRDEGAGVDEGSAMALLFVMHHATCARKALFALLEKGAPLPTREVDRAHLVTSEYRAMNPDGLVPTLLLDDGLVLVESSIIMRFIDEAYDGPPLQPADPLHRAQMDLWMKWIDEKYFPALGAPTIATFMRRMFGTPPDEARLQAMLDSLTDHYTRVMREDCIRNGLDSGFVAAGLAKLRDMLDKMDGRLAGHDWLAGDAISLADCATVPIILRLEEFGLAAAWEGRRPHLAAWWRRISERPALRQLVGLADQALLRELTDSVEDVRPRLEAALA